MALSVAALQLWGTTAAAVGSAVHSNDKGESFSAPCLRRTVLRSSSSDNGRGRMSVRAGVGSGGGAPGSFLTMEEAGLVEMASIDMHEKFLCRLTISSLNLLRVIAEQEGVAIEELNAGRVCDWFQKDKAKRETDMESATLKWESNDW